MSQHGPNVCRAIAVKRLLDHRSPGPAPDHLKFDHEGFRDHIDDEAERWVEAEIAARKADPENALDDEAIGLLLCKLMGR